MTWGEWTLGLRCGFGVLVWARGGLGRGVADTGEVGRVGLELTGCRASVRDVGRVGRGCSGGARPARGTAGRRPGPCLGR
ncbi:hypothetical protein [Streptomyces sp. NPDC003032]